MKKSTLALLMLVSPAVSAQAPGDDVRKIAYDQAVEAIDHLNDRIRTCEAKKDRKITKEYLPKLALSDKEWELALLYLSRRADGFCTGDAYGHALMHFIRYQIVEEEFTHKTIDQIVMPNKDIVTIRVLIGGDPVKHIEAEIKYQTLDAAAREKLEGVNTLKHPFKAISVEINK
jgi:hypothetical protein